MVYYQGIEEDQKSDSESAVRENDVCGVEECESVDLSGEEE